MQEIINSADSNGSLPLNLAIESNNLEMMEILIKEGARVSEETIYAAAREEASTPKVICIGASKIPFTCLPLVGHLLNKTDLYFHLHRTGNVELIKKLQELGLHHPRVKKLKEAERKTSFMVNTSVDLLCCNQ